MNRDDVPIDLQRRLTALQDPEEQGSGFTMTDWSWLLVLGLIGPVLLLIWGWV